jgi:hypothetical protein
MSLHFLLPSKDRLSRIWERTPVQWPSSSRTAGLSYHDSKVVKKPQRDRGGTGDTLGEARKQRRPAQASQKQGHLARPEARRSHRRMPRGRRKAALIDLLKDGATLGELQGVRGASAQEQTKDPPAHGAAHWRSSVPAIPARRHGESSERVCALAPKARWSVENEDAYLTAPITAFRTAEQSP